jgi:hypothetical protein
MRQKLNENPVAQIALIGVLALLAVVFLLKPFSGGEASPEAESGAEATTATASPEEAAASLGSSAAAAATSAVTAPAERPLPRDIESAYKSGETVVLLIYRPSGIDDRRLAAATSVVAGMPGVALFTAPVDEIARYSALTGPLGVDQAPALIVVRPRPLNGSNPAEATVDYGFRTAADVRQAVIDAGYRGPKLTYAPN